MSLIFIPKAWHALRQEQPYTSHRHHTCPSMFLAQRELAQLSSAESSENHGVHSSVRGCSLDLPHRGWGCSKHHLTLESDCTHHFLATRSANGEGLVQVRLFWALGVKKKSRTPTSRSPSLCQRSQTTLEAMMVHGCLHLKAVRRKD